MLSQKGEGLRAEQPEALVKQTNIVAELQPEVEEDQIGLRIDDAEHPVPIVVRPACIEQLIGRSVGPAAKPELERPNVIDFDGVARGVAQKALPTCRKRNAG